MHCDECGSLMKSEKDIGNDRETFICPECGGKLIKQYISGESSSFGNLAAIRSYYKEYPYIVFITLLVSIISFVVGLLVRNFWGLLIVVVCIAVSLLIPPWREKINEHRRNL